MLHRVSWQLPGWMDFGHPCSVELSLEEKRDLESFFEAEIGVGRLLSYKIVEETILGLETVQATYRIDVEAG